VIERTVHRIRQYAGDDPMINRCWMALEQERPRYDDARMEAMDIKRAYYVADMGMKGRSGEGRARRSQP
jgi:hypothetical protein